MCVSDSGKFNTSVTKLDFTELLRCHGESLRMWAGGL